MDNTNIRKDKKGYDAREDKRFFERYDKSYRTHLLPKWRRKSVGCKISNQE
jgi:hypothetical protein